MHNKRNCCHLTLSKGIIQALMSYTEPVLSDEQKDALDILRSGENVFLTGGAGSGKSFLIRHFMRELDPSEMPILASTGAAAVLLGGRTFHSFFGLGIMEGGAKAAFDKAMNDKKLLSRLRNVEGIIIDEISMIPGKAFMVAEALSRAARESNLPWGGMRVIVVGDFLQLPPVTISGPRDWCFLTAVWKRSGFRPVELSHNQRVKDNLFLDILGEIRRGQVSERVRDFLNEHLRDHDESDSGTRLFARKNLSEAFNERKLSEIDEDEIRIPTIYIGDERSVSILKKNAPVPENLVLKIGCEIMLLQNDPQRRWVNGTRGTMVDFNDEQLVIRKSKGRIIEVPKASFTLQNADGEVLAHLEQFPVTLAYATTIHKSQGATMSEVWCDLSRLWEPGQAYVALSRLRSAEGLKLIGWSPRSIVVDPIVLDFYKNLQATY